MTTPSKASARMTPTDAPEPTPLERAYAAADAASDMVTPPDGVTHEAWLAEHGTLAYRRGMVHAAVTALLAGDWLERVLGDHVLLRVAVAPGRNGWACACGNRYVQESRQGASRPDGAHAAHQAAAIRATAGVNL